MKTDDSNVSSGLYRPLRMTDTERNLVLRGFNNTACAYRLERLVHELFEEQAARTPDSVAVIDQRQSLTYAELNGKANQLARYLRERGVGPDQVVGICLERGPWMVIGVLGILKAGGGYLPLNPSHPAERLRYIVDDAQPRMVLTQASLTDRLPSGKTPLIALDTQAQEIAAFDDANLPPHELGASTQQLVFVIYTSRSTGQPIGTEMAHRSMVNLIEWYHSCVGSAAGMRVMQFAALTFGPSFDEIFSTLCTGGTLVLLDEHVRRDDRALTELLRAQHITRLFVPPQVLQSIAEYCASSAQLPGELRDVIAIGAPLRLSAEVVSLLERLNRCRLHYVFGPTELHVVTARTLGEDREEGAPLPGRLDRPIANTQLYVLDEERRPVPIGVAGEVYVGGVAVARGYLGRPELTAQRFVPDPFSSDPRARLYRTGDVGRWCVEGRIEIFGHYDNYLRVPRYMRQFDDILRRMRTYEAQAQVAATELSARETHTYSVPIRGSLSPRLKAKIEQLRLQALLICKAHRYQPYAPTAQTMNINDIYPALRQATLDEVEDGEARSFFVSFSGLVLV